MNARDLIVCLIVHELGRNLGHRYHPGGLNPKVIFGKVYTPSARNYVIAV